MQNFSGYNDTLIGAEIFRTNKKFNSVEILDNESLTPVCVRPISRRNAFFYFVAAADAS
jgi:hypothetical protein